MASPDNFTGVTLPDSPVDPLAIPTQPPMPFTSPDELTPSEATLFETLVTVGKLTKMVTVAGHRLYMETLKDNEELEVGLIIKPFAGSDAYQRAYKLALVAAAVREVDGRPVYTPLSPNEDVSLVLRKKFAIWSEYYPVITDLIYAEVVKLEQELLPLVEKLKKTLG